VSTELRSHDL